MIDKFDPKTAEKLGHYVYRLIDPRNGQTFYVGKGQGNRVFDHIKCVANEETDEGANQNSDKIGRILQIKKDGFKITHIIHRHGLDKDTALEVEAALIDAYPETLNENLGHNTDCGIMHTEQVIKKYQAEEIQQADINRYKLLFININRTAGKKEVYDAVRYAWRISKSRAEKVKYVLAVERGLVVGVFVADGWMEATKANFPNEEGEPNRYGFEGEEAPDNIKNLFQGKRLPDNMRGRSPIRYSS